VPLARRCKEKTAEAGSFSNQEASAIDGPAAHKFFSFLVPIRQPRDSCALPRAGAIRNGIRSLFRPGMPLTIHYGRNEANYGRNEEETADVAD